MAIVPCTTMNKWEQWKGQQSEKELHCGHDGRVRSYDSPIYLMEILSAYKRGKAMVVRRRYVTKKGTPHASQAFTTWLRELGELITGTLPCVDRPTAIEGSGNLYR